MTTFIISTVILFFVASTLILKPLELIKNNWPYILGVLFVIVSTVLYYNYGAVKAWQQFQFQEEAVQKMLDELQSPKIVAQRLKEKLQHEPNSAQGWFLLGRLYRSTGEIENAVDAFTKAFNLDRTNAVYFNAYIEARYWLNDALFQPVDIKLIKSQKRLKLDNQNISYLAGFYLQHHDYEKSLHYWELLLAKIDKSPDVEYEVREAYKDTKKKIRLQKFGRIQVSVTMNEILRKQYPKDASVFVYAKVSHAGPPIAAARRLLRELPTDVVLSDAEAMLPNRLLSQYYRQNVFVYARLEPTGRLTKSKDVPHDEKQIYFERGSTVKLDLQPMMKKP